VNLGICSCYYNEEFGYIITSYAIQEGSRLSRAIEPVIIKGEEYR